MSALPAIAPVTGPITMSSREIAEYVGAPHDSVLKTVRQHAVVQG